jgi:hypothetical protein
MSSLSVYLFSFHAAHNNNEGDLILFRFTIQMSVCLSTASFFFATKKKTNDRFSRRLTIPSFLPSFHSCQGLLSRNVCDVVDERERISLIPAMFSAFQSCLLILLLPVEVSMVE